MMIRPFAIRDPTSPSTKPPTRLPAPIAVSMKPQARFRIRRWRRRRPRGARTEVIAEQDPDRATGATAAWIVFASRTVLGAEEVPARLELGRRTPSSTSRGRSRATSAGTSRAAAGRTTIVAEEDGGGEVGHGVEPEGERERVPRGRRRTGPRAGSSRRPRSSRRPTSRSSPDAGPPRRRAAAGSRPAPAGRRSRSS